MFFYKTLINSRFPCASIRIFRMSSFRQFVWDPVLLVSQMTCLQTFFYATQTSVMLFCSFFGYEPLISSIFSIQVWIFPVYLILKLLFQTQRSMALIQLVSAVGVSFALSHLVQRAKQCLDFACTVHFFHLIFTTIYNHALPTQFTWLGFNYKTFEIQIPF